MLDVYYEHEFDPLKEVLLTEPVKVENEKNFYGQIEKMSYYPNRVILKTTQNGEGFLVLLDTYFPGWKVEVDGKSGHILRANYFYRGVRLSPGNHRIEFSYEPAGLKMGVAVSSAVSLILLSILFLKSFRKTQ